MPLERKKKVTHAIIENANIPHPKPLTQLAQDLGVSVQTIYTLVSRLRRQGRLAATTRQSVGSIPPQPPPSLPGSELARQAILQQALDATAPLNRTERIKRLSQLARGPRDAITIQAIKALEDMDQRAATQIGPPPPLTDHEKTERLARLMLMVGPEITEQAKLLAFSTSTTLETLYPEAENAEKVTEVAQEGAESPQSGSNLDGR